jgi:xylan 1,4-beta-xylosidase
LTQAEAPDTGAKADWDRRIGQASGVAVTGSTGPPRLDPPRHLHADTGVGQVTIGWEAVPGAVGYLVLRGPADGGPLEPVNHGGGDVLVVPAGPYTDTTGEPGVPYRYAVATASDTTVVGDPSPTVVAHADLFVAGAALPVVTVRVDTAKVARVLPRPWRPMIGSEHLSLLLSDETIGGQSIAADLATALRAAHDELGVQAVRAHAILCDDLGVYREVDGEPVHDFTGVDRVCDRLRELGLRPVVELSFMPRDLASDPAATVFEYRGIVSPPKDWDRWGDLIRALVSHLVERYGRDEVRQHWSFEVWNEANLGVFWSGTPEEFWRLYDVTAQAVRDVDPGLVVGGPSTAAAAWVDELLAHIAVSGAPLDFVSTHTYGNAPLDLRPTLARHGRADAKIWWTEWGVSPTHYGPANDGVFSAVFLARGMLSGAGRLDALSYWVVSDHFEELGRPRALMHNGFGLRTVGELRKPRWWALHLLERLGEQEVAVALDGDGAGGMVQAWASRDPGPDGSPRRAAVAVWNGTLDQSKVGGAAHLDRQVTMTVDGLADGTHLVTEWRIDERHSNIAATWRELGDGADWPDDAQWAALRAADRLELGSPEQKVVAIDGHLTLAVDLPMPGFILLEIVPVGL